jgi:hypothetical protein
MFTFFVAFADGLPAAVYSSYDCGFYNHNCNNELKLNISCAVSVEEYKLT